LIAGRRPYDLGDRIYMIDSSDAHSNAITSSWFIEGKHPFKMYISFCSCSQKSLCVDINLSFTTVRFAATNEVATVSNGAIAGLRIVNANRSPNAVVTFELPFHIRIVDDTEKMEKIRKALDQYARDFPNHWKCFMLCRVNVLHIELEQALLFFSFQHQSSWQDVGRILIDKADLLCFVYELGKKLGINYDELPARHLVYGAGVLHDGVARSCRRDMIIDENVKSILNDTTTSTDNVGFKQNDQFLKSLQQTFD
jgi:small-conductance mechanosensitive channel